MKIVCPLHSLLNDIQEWIAIIGSGRSQGHQECAGDRAANLAGYSCDCIQEDSPSSEALDKADVQPIA